MPLATRAPQQFPDYWHIWGHSYVAGVGGALDQTGRVDSTLRGAFDTEANNFQNHAVSGSNMTVKGRSTAGWTRVMQEKVPSLTRGGPYAPDGGASVLFWGINDLGLLGNDTQMRTSYKNALRAIISRCRASKVFEDTNAAFAYGAGFTNLGGMEDIGSGTSCRQATSTTSATITFTIPADYKGETIALLFWGVPHATANGGTVTFSGTAGMTGTLYTGGAMPAATLSQTAMVRRYVAPVTGATQTIIATVTQIDAGGTVYFDCAWFEALNPPAVLVTNINRLTASGYAFYGGWSGTEGQKDQHVLDWNAEIVACIGEFDSMVQLVDIDALIGKNTETTFDGIHPNEYGAGLIVDAMLQGLRRIYPSGPYGTTASINPPARRNGQMLRPRIATYWYTADSRQYGTNYTAVAGDMFAIPFQITQPRDRWNRCAIEAIASITGTAVRWGIYDDIGQSGYPQCLVTEFTSAGAFTITTGAGRKDNPASGTGSFSWIPDPGLYWLAVKFTTIGASHTFRTVAGMSMMLPNANTTTTPGGLTPSGWKLTGQGTTAFPTTFLTTAALSDNCPAIFMQLAQTT